MIVACRDLARAWIVGRIINTLIICRPFACVSLHRVRVHVFAFHGA